MRDSSMWQAPVSCFLAYKRGIRLQRGVGKAKHDRQAQHPNQDGAHHSAAHGLPKLILAIVGSLAVSSSLLMRLCGMSYTMVSCWPRRSEFVPKWSGCGQDLAPSEAYSTGKRSSWLPLVSASAEHEAGQDGIRLAHKGGAVMKNLMVGSVIFMLVTLGWSNRSLGEQVPTPRGELRIVDNSSFNFVTVVFNVFEHLLDIEEGGKLVPRLATGWRWVDDRTLEMTLRQRVKFHNDEPFDAAVVNLNWDENTHVQQPFRAGQFLSFKPGWRLE